MEIYLLTVIKFPKEDFDLFLDVGLSWNAPTSVEMLNANPNIFVIGVEPNPRSCSNVRSLNLGDRFHLIESGASDVEEQRDFNCIASDAGRSSDEGTSSFLKINPSLVAKDCDIKETIQVKTITLEKVLDLVPWDRVRDGVFDMKSDTQGYEDKVIKGLGHYISRLRFLKIESTTWGDYENASNHDDVKNLLNDYMIQITNQGGDAWFKRK
jgi:FkbM family methyltransferase